VAVDELAKVVDEWAGRLASLPTRAIGQTKLLVNRALQSDLDTALRDEAVAQELVQQTHDAKEGVRAFVERRDPDFKGW
jgi:2-(1,2-epoxy-1,2-dihydrophenyl)acetyl-CoA isomerase